MAQSLKSLYPPCPQAMGPSVLSATASEFRRWRRKFKQYFLGSDLGITHLPGQQAAHSGCVEQHLYNSISDNPPHLHPGTKQGRNHVLHGLHPRLDHGTPPPGLQANGAIQAFARTGGIHSTILQQDLQPGRQVRAE